MAFFLGGETPSFPFCASLTAGTLWVAYCLLSSVLLLS